MEMIDTVSPDQWRKMSGQQRIEFHRYWANRGIGSFRCLNCSFPTIHGQGRCEVCKDD